MIRFTGTEEDFRRLAPQGLVLYNDYCGGIIFYYNGKFRWISATRNPQGLLPFRPNTYRFIQELSGAWSYLQRPEYRAHLYVLVPPKALYTRTLHART